MPGVRLARIPRSPCRAADVEYLSVLEHVSGERAVGNGAGEFVAYRVSPRAVEDHAAEMLGEIRRGANHADLARRRYLTADPGNRLVASTLEADWNTALRALNDAQAAHAKARTQASLPVSARAVTSPSSPYWAASRPRSRHHQPSAAASRAAAAGSCSTAQASACRIIASSASSHRAAASRGPLVRT